MPANADKLPNFDGLFDEAIQATQQQPSLPILAELTSRSVRYRDGDKVAEGGLKIISVAEDLVTGRLLAMATPKDGSPDGAELFLREARMTANLTHPNIIPVFDIGLKADQTPFFTMKLIQGMSLAEALASRSGRQARREIADLTSRIDLFLRVCDAVAYAHSRGVIHLDIKPGNIQVGEFGEVLLCDWGLAKILDESCDDPHLERYSFDDHERRHLTLSGRIKGTPGYMAPEQCGAFAGRKDEHTDIFALGAVLYELATFNRPVATGDLKRAIQDTRTGKLRAIPSTVPEGLRAIIAKALQHRPQDRYDRVETMIADLQAWRHGFVTSVEAPSLWRNGILLYRRQRHLWLLTALFGAILFGAATTFLVRISSSRQLARSAQTVADAERQQRLSLQQQSAPLLLSRAQEAYDAGQLAEAATLADAVLAFAPDMERAGNLRADVNFAGGHLSNLADMYHSPMTPLQQRCQEMLRSRLLSPETPLSKDEIMPLIQIIREKQLKSGLTLLRLWLEHPDADVGTSAAQTMVAWTRLEQLPQLIDMLPQLPPSFQETAVRHLLTHSAQLPSGLLERKAPAILALALPLELRLLLLNIARSNLALGAAISCSDPSSTAPAGLVDGQLNDRWQPKNAPCDLIIDLRQKRSIASVVVFTSSWIPPHRVSISQNGVDYALVAADAGGPPRQSDCPTVHTLITPLPARYLKIHLRPTDTGIPYAINEIQVWDQNRNLALGKPTSSSSERPQFASSRAVNGRAPLNEYWEENYPPVFLTVDLEKNYRISEVRTSFFYDGSRYYQYEILVSTDGILFTRVADRSANTVPSQESPMIDHLDPVDARFVRIRVLKNSANPGVHIRELEVYPALADSPAGSGAP